jgi:hypothetical protein
LITPNNPTRRMNGPARTLAGVGLSAAAGLFLAMTGALMLAGAARAEDTAQAQLSGEQKQACTADFKRLCPGVMPGGGRVKQCFTTHYSELSPMCQAAVQANQSSN